MLERGGRLAALASVVVCGGAALLSCGGGGGGAGSSFSTGRYSLNTNALMEHANASIPRPVPTILRAELVLDGDVIATFESAGGEQYVQFIAKEVLRDAGQARLDFRILAQTVASAPYVVTPSSFVGIVDTQTGRFTTKPLNRGSLNLPYSQVLRAGDAISVTFAVP